MSVEIVTFGCRLNAFESEVILREAECAGLADTIVINSCAVTNEAVAQARQSIRRLKRANRVVRITLPGGELTIEWREGDDHVLMTGTATFEYEGRFDPALFASVA
jgi:tRNA A37 methylthiotransferase MiaB